MVAGFQDDLDPDDVQPSHQATRTSVPSKDLNITLSSDDEDARVRPARPVVASDLDLETGFDPDL